MIDKALDPANDIGHIVFLDLTRYSRSKVGPHIFLAKLYETDMTVHSVRDGKRSDTDGIPWDIHRNLQFVPEQPRDGAQEARHQVPLEAGGLLRRAPERGLNQAGLPYDHSAAKRHEVLINPRANQDEIQRSYEIVLTDPQLALYEKPAEARSVDAQGFMVNLY